MILGRADDFAHALRGTDVAGIDPQTRGSRFGGFDRTFVVKMNVGHDGHGCSSDDLLEGPRRVFIRTGNPYDIGPGLFERANLRNGCSRIARHRVGHALDGNRGVAADFDFSNPDFARLAPNDVPIRSDTQWRHLFDYGDPVSVPPHADTAPVSVPLVGARLIVTIHDGLRVKR